MKIKFTLLLFIVALLISKPNISHAQINTKDSLALVDLYNNTNGPNWKHHYNWLTSAPVQNWDGIYVSKNRIFIISLSDNNLTGSIPSSLGNLTKLYDLDLYGNHLSGSIPSSLGNLTNLQYVFLEYNQLSGNIPASLGNLAIVQDLWLFHNKLSGSIPATFIKLANISSLALDHNQLSGGIPSFFGDFTNLVHLYLNNNKLSGGIPETFGKLTNIYELDLQNNQLSGTIPSQLINLTTLAYLYLKNNKLSGSIPPLQSRYLTVLNLANNQLTGTIPVSLGNCKYLNELDLGNNNLNDSLPSNIGNLNHLQNLNLSHNCFAGNIPSTFSNLKHLELLNISYNRFSGSAPSFLTSLYKLKQVFLQHNSYTFDGMEQLAQHNFDTLNYAWQKLLFIHQHTNILSVYAGGTLSNNTYRWFKNGQLIKTIHGDSTYHPNAAGFYNVIVNNSIATELKLFSDVTFYCAQQNFAETNTNLSDENFASAISVYPNPAKTNATVLFKAAGKYVIEIADMNGKILQTKAGVSIDKKQNTVQLNVSSYASGIYFITITDEKNKKQILKLNKE